MPNSIIHDKGNIGMWINLRKLLNKLSLPNNTAGFNNQKKTFTIMPPLLHHNNDTQGAS